MALETLEAPANGVAHKVRKNRVVIDLEKAQDLKAQGQTITAIAALLKVSPATLNYQLNKAAVKPANSAPVKKARKQRTRKVVGSPAKGFAQVAPLANLGADKTALNELAQKYREAANEHRQWAERFEDMASQLFDVVGDIPAQAE